MGRLTGKSVIQIAMPFRGEGAEQAFLRLALLDLERATQTQRAEMAALLLKTLLWSSASTLSFEVQRESVKAVERPADWLRIARGETATRDLAPAAMACAHARMDPRVMADRWVSVCQPTETIVSAVQARYGPLLWSTAGLAVALLVASVTLAEVAIRRPYRHFMQAIDRVATGELNQPVTEQTPAGEWATCWPRWSGCASLCRRSNSASTATSRPSSTRPIPTR